MKLKLGKTVSLTAENVGLAMSEPLQHRGGGGVLRPVLAKKLAQVHMDFQDCVQGGG